MIIFLSYFFTSLFLICLLFSFSFADTICPLKSRNPRESAQKVKLVVQREIDLNRRRKKLKPDVDVSTDDLLDKDNLKKLKPKSKLSEEVEEMTIDANSDKKLIVNQELKTETIAVTSTTAVPTVTTSAITTTNTATTSTTSNTTISTFISATINSIYSPSVTNTNTTTTTNITSTATNAAANIIPNSTTNATNSSKQANCKLSLNSEKNGQFNCLNDLTKGEFKNDNKEKEDNESNLLTNVMDPLKKEQTLSYSSCSSRCSSDSESTVNDSLDSNLKSEDRSISRPGIVFKVGEKLEACDVSGKWYPSKIVTIDDSNKDVLIHFERWSSRFDQWFSMKSSMLRPRSDGKSENLCHNDSEPTKMLFNIGDKVLARWSDSKKYPGVISNVFSDSSYNILFYDGYRKKVKSKSIEPLPENYEGCWIPPVQTNCKVIDTTAEPEVHKPSNVYPVARKAFTIEEDHNHYKCTVEDCGKAFRKEKLLISHIKHYHPHLFTDSRKSNPTSPPSSASPIFNKLSETESLSLNTVTSDSANKIPDSTIDSSEVYKENKNITISTTPMSTAVGTLTPSSNKLSTKHVLSTKSKKSISRKFNTSSSSNNENFQESLDHQPGNLSLTASTSVPKSIQTPEVVTKSVKRSRKKTDSSQIIESSNQSVSKKSSKAKTVALTESTESTTPSTLEMSLESSISTTATSTINHNVINNNDDTVVCPLTSPLSTSISLTKGSTSKKIKRKKKPRQDSKSENSVSSEKKRLKVDTSLTSIKSSESQTTSQLLPNDQVPFIATSQDGLSSELVSQAVAKPIKRSTRKRKSRCEAFRDSSIDRKLNRPKLVCDKMSNSSPLDFFYDDSVPIPNTVLPFWDARTIRDIHESDEVDELVHCICDLRDESGLMVQCDFCLTWQHGMCFEIESEKEVPEVYICFACKNPRLVRESSRYKYDFDWLKRGKLSKFPALLSTFEDGENEKERDEIALSKEQVLSTNQLLNALLEIVNIFHSLKFKIGLYEKKNSDLMFWSYSWLNKEPRLSNFKENTDLVSSVNEFDGLKVNEADMIGDIFKYSKNILENVPLEQDISSVPDDLKNELLEDTDLINFIASSYSEMNETKEARDVKDTLSNEMTITDANSKLVENELEAKNSFADKSLFSFKGSEKESSYLTTNVDNQADKMSLSSTQEEETQALKEIKNCDEDSQKTILNDTNENSEVKHEETKESTKPVSIKSNSEDTETSEETEMSQEGFIAEPNGTLMLSNLESNLTTNETSRQNLLDHILDVQRKITERLNLIEKCARSLEEKMELESDDENIIRQDRASFSELVKGLYKDLDIVAKIAKCRKQVKVEENDLEEKIVS